MDLITGLTCCPRMKLYASCSMDGTIRIWSEENVLVRLLRINTMPHSISFCSSKGDLLVGISNHLFLIPHTKYLPKSYLKRQVCMRFFDVKPEFPLEYDENKIKNIDKNDVKRLKNSHASFKFDHFVDILSTQEQEEMMREKKKKAEAFGLLEIRENEIQQIRDGALIARKKPKQTKRTQARAFKQYMKMYYDKEKEKLPPDEDTDQILQRKQREEEALLLEEEEDDAYRPDTAPYGFFAELADQSDPASPLHACYPSTPCGYLPNSVLVKILYPPPVSKEASREATPYTPPELSAQQLAEINSLHSTKKFGRRDSDLDASMSRNVTFAADDHLSRVLEIDLSEDEEAAGLEHQDTLEDGVTPFQFDESMRGPVDSAGGVSSGAATIATPARSSAVTQRTFSDMTDSRFTTPKTPQKSRMSRKKKTSFYDDDNDDEDDDAIFGLSEKSTSLMSKFQELMDKPPSETGSPERTPEPTTPEPVKRPPPSMAKPITKLVSRPKPKARTPSPPRSPTPPPPPTPLPGFIKQFVGTEWFDKYFPNCNENTMPKPWNADTFVNMIVKLLRIAVWLHKVAVIEAISSVHTQEGLSDQVSLNVVKTLLAVLNHHTTPPSCSEGEQKDFIISALRAISSFGVKEKDVIAELMVQFLDGDRDVRGLVKEVMANLGLVDPHRQFQKELDSWDIWSIDEKNHLDELHKMSNQWLDRWMASYKLRIQDTVEKLNKGHSLHGRLSHRGSVMPASRRGSMMPPDMGRSGRESGMSHASNLTVALDRLQGSSIIEAVSYIDAVTYFCEMMTEKELEALRRGEVLRGKGEKVVQAKNTVLVLPKIAHKPALVRLGEMHTSKCRPERETALHTDFHMPPITTRGRHPVPGDLNGFVSCINLPMKQVYLNPFPSPLDERDSYFRQPVLITLKSSQKYFIPSQSYVPAFDDQVAAAT